MKIIVIAIVLCAVSAQFGSRRVECDDDWYEDYDKDNRRGGNGLESRRCGRRPVGPFWQGNEVGFN